MGNETTRFMPARKSKDEVRQIYARLSKTYDIWSSLTEQKATTRALELARIRNGEKILEVAVGTGQVFEKILSLNADGRNEGIDLSPAMLAKAEKRLSGRFSGYSLKVADAFSLPFPDETFDLIVNNYMFDLLPEQDFSRVLREFKRVLKPGGRVVITTMTMGKRWYSRIWDRIARSTDLLAGCRPVSLVEDITRFGFQNIHVEYISQFTFPSLVIRGEKPMS
jgi:ubiquinone/menaquinone biosynthesis C-methylase UbiE